MALGIFVVNGRAAGIYCRLSAQALINDDADEAIVLMQRTHA